MMLGTKGRYAVTAMVDIARYGQGKPVTLADISRRQEIALSYLEQLFGKLKRAGIVKSVRGPGGGYVLAHEARNTIIADIVLAVEESIKMTRCGHIEGGCMTDKARCLTHDLWEGLEGRIFEYLNSITLQDICERKLLQRNGIADGHDGLMFLQGAM